ncbi:transcription repressor MYB4-like protein [Corchorus olitorius]|uniref:Transcription repressor MYB4-like protein n=1 Tax=Corchorus olitorius TaxID=93759 RepID=A0A1R3H3D6_9ROSI|nr:transcription repressor MYB4-like protein [Corchorus olitorius]
MEQEDSAQNGQTRQDISKAEVRIISEDVSSTKVEFSEDEEMLIARMFNLVGDRTAGEIERYWTSRRSSQSGSARAQPKMKLMG